MIKLLTCDTLDQLEVEPGILLPAEENSGKILEPCATTSIVIIY